MHYESLILYYPVIMFVRHCSPVYFRHNLFQFLIVHHIILAFLRVVGSGEDKELRRKGVEHRRYGRESVTAACEVNVFLSERQQELLHIDTIRRTDIRLAVVEDQESVDEIVLDVFKNILLAVTDESSCATILPYPLRKIRVNERDVFPFVFVRRYNQCAPSLFESLVEYLA